MNINSLYKKEGIEEIQKMKQKEVNAIAKDIAIKLCLAFPEQNLNRNVLFDNISTINMYRAKMSKDSSGAKYLAKANSIYFNNELDFSELPDVAMHECIHFLQHSRSNGQMGLYNYSNGLALNEASVQLMASYANMCENTQEKLYGITINTNSPTYYPLECAIVKQMAYFTGSYPLYSSTLNSNDIFKHTFISKFNKKIYNHISKELDKLLNLENDTHFYSVELSYATKERQIKHLNNIISAQKKEIAKQFFNIQNYIIKNCFCIEFSNITNNTLLSEFKKNIYRFKNVIGYTDEYTYYNDFYCDMMNAVEQKKKEIINSATHEIKPTALIVVDKKRPSLLLMYNAIRKLKKLIGLNVQEEV